MKAGVLVISYNGMLEPLGQSQVLSYQEELAADYRVHLVSFERSEDLARKDAYDATRSRMIAAGITWIPLRYHKRLSVFSTFWDIFCGTVLGMRLVRKHGLNIVHARSYVPSMMALVLKRLTGVRYIFDMRGYWADERVDGGIWPRGGVMFRIAKAFERKFLLSADHVVSVTRAAVEDMAKFDYLAQHMPPMSVIPPCANLERFAPQLVPATGGFVVGYVGSAGTWYRFDKVAHAFAALYAINKATKFLIINRHEQGHIRECLTNAGVPLSNVEIRSALHSEIPGLMARMSAAVFFIKPLYSKIAAAPVRLPEFLGMGIPCLSNRGVGDMAAVLEGGKVGIAISDFSDEQIHDGAMQLIALAMDPATRTRCVKSAHEHFSLIDGVSRFRDIYRSLSS